MDQGCNLSILGNQEKMTEALVMRRWILQRSLRSNVMQLILALEVYLAESTIQ